MVCAPADDARAEPAELAVLSDRVRLAVYVPITVWSAEISPLLASEVLLGVRTSASMVNLIGQQVLLEILGRVEHGSGFEKGDVHAEIGKDFDGGPAAGSGADDDDVENLGTASDLKH